MCNAPLQYGDSKKSRRMVCSHIIIFDGICNFCNASVNFIIKRDPQAIYKFTPMQSELAQQLMAEHGIADADLDTFVLIKNGQCHVRTDAALEIAKDLSGFWHLCGAFRILPGPLRDFCYRLLAKNRYRLFGKRESCMVPTPEIRSRFVGLPP